MTTMQEVLTILMVEAAGAKGITKMKLMVIVVISMEVMVAQGHLMFTMDVIVAALVAPIMEEVNLVTTTIGMVVILVLEKII
ncbi:expressed protein [Phakopsora pachyrhizi]|uniref:Expressed protein n=1 Tax=Phakopsora pachyrhizi TaxID=170000 RepID=A0AAV0BIZ9_PHAPC|nr:expressed protein [Phakopsora pachyrhizi]